jgi:hypothetical protein
MENPARDEASENAGSSPNKKATDCKSTSVLLLQLWGAFRVREANNVGYCGN